MPMPCGATRLRRLASQARLSNARRRRSLKSRSAPRQAPDGARRARSASVVSVGPESGAVRAFHGAVGLPGSALAFSEQVTRLFRCGLGCQGGAQILFGKCYGLLEAAARALLDAITDEERRHPPRTRRASQTRRSRRSPASRRQSPQSTTFGGPALSASTGAGRLRPGPYPCARNRLSLLGNQSAGRARMKDAEIGARSSRRCAGQTGLDQDVRHAVSGRSPPGSFARPNDEASHP